MSASATNWLAQVATVTKLNLLTLRQRLGASLAATFGVAGVVAVFVFVLSIGEGFRATLETSGAPDSVMVLRGGTDTEMNSLLSREETRVIMDGPGVRREGGKPVASAELFVIVDLDKRSTGTPANVPLRGVEPAAFDIRGNIQMVSGRRFTPGRNEVIAGSGAARQFAGLDLGSTLRWGENSWEVVGIFNAGGTIAESEIWCDVGVLQPAYRRGDTFQSVLVKLETPEGFEAFKDALTTDPRVDVKVQRESEYYAEQSRMLVAIVTGLGTVIAGLMAVGAVFGALLTMYSAVAARVREIATLRALGFGGGPLVISVLFEAMLLTLVGGTIGAGLAWLAFDGYRTSTLNWQSFSQVAFAFQVTPRLLVQGVVAALVMGLVGGLFPAIRAARLGVAAALREL